MTVGELHSPAGGDDIVIALNNTENKHRRVASEYFSWYVMSHYNSLTSGQTKHVMLITFVIFILCSRLTM